MFDPLVAKQPHILQHSDLQLNFSAFTRKPVIIQIQPQRSCKHESDMVPRKASLLPEITVACASAVFSSLGSFLDRKGTGSIVQNPIVFSSLFRPKAAQKGEYLRKPNNSLDKSFFPKLVHFVTQIWIQKLSLQHRDGFDPDPHFLDWFVSLCTDKGIKMVFIKLFYISQIQSANNTHGVQMSLAKVDSISLEFVCQGRWSGECHKLNVSSFCLFLMADICLHCFFCTRAHINSKPRPQCVLSAIFLFSSLDSLLLKYHILIMCIAMTSLLLNSAAANSFSPDGMMTCPCGRNPSVYIL